MVLYGRARTSWEVRGRLPVMTRLIKASQLFNQYFPKTLLLYIYSMWWNEITFYTCLIPLLPTQSEQIKANAALRRVVTPAPDTQTSDHLTCPADTLNCTWIALWPRFLRTAWLPPALPFQPKSKGRQCVGRSKCQCQCCCFYNSHKLFFTSEVQSPLSEIIINK